MWDWLLWFFFGCVAGGVLTYIVMKLKRQGIIPRWYEWALGGAALLIIVLMVQTFFASLAENEARAAWMSLGFMGFAALVLVVVTIRSIKSRTPKHSGP